MSADAMTIARKSAEAMWAEDDASRGLGMELREVGPGSAVVAMTITQSMVNGHGTCHGGYLFTLADSAFAFACNSHNLRCVAQHCTITFIAPARLGDKLIATGREISRAGRSGITDVRVTREDGALIAEFRGNSRQIKGEIVPGLTPPKE